MAVYIVLTYDIVDSGKRKELVDKFKEIISKMGLREEPTNQSTYYGSFRSSSEFIKELNNSVSKFDWKEDDSITVYYPKATPRPNGQGAFADIGRHYLKSKGSNFLNPVLTGS